MKNLFEMEDKPRCVVCGHIGRKSYKVYAQNFVKQPDYRRNNHFQMYDYFDRFELKEELISICNFCLYPLTKDKECVKSVHIALGHLGISEHIEQDRDYIYCPQCKKLKIIPLINKEVKMCYLCQLKKMLFIFIEDRMKYTKEFEIVLNKEGEFSRKEFIKKELHFQYPLINQELEEIRNIQSMPIYFSGELSMWLYNLVWLSQSIHLEYRYISERTYLYQGGRKIAERYVIMLLTPKKMIEKLYSHYQYLTTFINSYGRTAFPELKKETMFNGFLTSMREYLIKCTDLILELLHDDTSEVAGIIRDFIVQTRCIKTQDESMTILL